MSKPWVTVKCGQVNIRRGETLSVFLCPSGQVTDDDAKHVWLEVDDDGSITIAGDEGLKLKEWKG
jgi:hypothetical protein